MRLGIHIPLKGGFEKNILRAKAIGCETVQLFAGNPTGWRLAAADEAEIGKRSSLLEQQQIYPLVVHSAYLVNLASPTPDFLEKSTLLLQATMERAAMYGSPYVVLHTGNHGGQGLEKGLEQIVETISALQPHWPPGVTLLLENTAGSGTALGSRLEELSRIIQSFPPGFLGICFDTAHAWGAGYDCGAKGGIEEILEQFDKYLGLAHLKVIHLNDSKAALGSRVDRHEHIGRGAISLEGFKALLNYPWPEDFPFILETPEIGTEWDQVNLEAVRALLE